MTRPGAFSAIALGSDQENSIAHDLAMRLVPDQNPWSRDHFERTLDVGVDASIGDTYGLYAAFRADVSLSHQHKPDRAQRQSTSEAFLIAADKLETAALHGLASLATGVGAIYDTSGKRDELAAQAGQRLLQASLGQSHAVAPVWFAKGLARLSKAMPAATKTAIFAQYLDYLKTIAGDTGRMDHAAEGCLVFAQVPSEKEATNRALVAGKERAANESKSPLLKMAWLEEAMKIASETLHDSKEAHRLAALHRAVDPMPAMARFGTEIDLEVPLKALEVELDGIMKELGLEGNPALAVQVAVLCFHQVFFIPMPAPTFGGPPSISDIMPTTAYHAGDKTLKRPKDPQNTQSGIARSMAAQTYDFQAMWTLEHLRQPLLGRLLDYLTEVEADGRLPGALQQLKPALAAYLRAEWYSAACLAAIALEAMMREVCTAGGHPPHYYRDSGTHNSLLGTMVSDAAIEPVLGSHLARQLRYMEDDEDGQNGRNTLLHGNLTPSEVPQSMAARYVYSVLTLFSRLILFARQKEDPTPFSTDDSEE